MKNKTQLNKTNDKQMLEIALADETQLPDVISSQFTEITKLEKKVEKAVKMASKAKEKASDAQVSAGWFKKKAAIELLQDATQGLAEAQIDAAEAQKISFEYQTKLTEITKFLFGLGVSNIAMNRSVVRELELRLKGASDKDISDLAKQELHNVIMQLNAQRDMMEQQARIKEEVKKLDKQVDELEIQDQKQDDKIAENAETIEKQGETLSIQQKKDDEHDRKFAEKDKEDAAQDMQIAENVQKLLEHSKTLEQHHEKDEVIAGRTEENADKIKFLQDEIIKQEQSFDKELITVKKNLESNEKKIQEEIRLLSASLSREIKWRIGISIVAVGSLILNVLHMTGIL